MFAHDLCYSRIEYLRNSTDFNRKDRATRGAHAAQALALRERLRLRPVSLREAYGLEALRERFLHSFRLRRINSHFLGSGLSGLGIPNHDDIKMPRHN